MTDLDLYFRFKCEKGLKLRGLDTKQEYIDRLKYETDVIVSMGFAGYFLIVSDYMKWALDNKILIAPGRGSIAGSLAAYCLYISHLDPIKWNLLFERFMNPDRISMPDADCDFMPSRRHEVIEYVANKYGHNNVCHIGTFGFLRAKNAVRTIARTLGHPYEIGDHLSKLLLGPISGKPQPLASSIQQVPELGNYIKQGGTYKEVLILAQKIEGLINNNGIHAGGIIIANEDLTDKIPLWKGKNGEIVSQWEMNTIEEVGYIKFDFLGVEALDKIDKCLELVKDRHRVNIDIYNLPTNDEAVFQKLREGDVVGIFQLEGSSGIKELTMQIAPKSIEDLSTICAVYRPGPLGSPELDHYIKVRQGKEKPHYLIPELEPILGFTQGLIVYQEQPMRIARDLCGYTGGSVDELRKGIGKKKQEIINKHEKLFKDGWIANGYPAQAVEELWEQIVSFGSYGFNLAHSASYATIAYITAYLKTHYTAEFMCAVMISESGDRDDIIKCITECKRLGINVLPPDINKSNESFSVSAEKEIRFGLGPIKNLGEKPVGEIISERRGGKFKSLLDFCERVNTGVINRLKVESLIRAGAFDTLHESRKAMLDTINQVWDWREAKKRFESKLETYYKKVEAYEQRLKDIEAGVLSPTGKKLSKLKKPVPPEPPGDIKMSEVDEMSEVELQKNEHELLGFYVSSHPLEGIRHVYGNGLITSIEQAKQLDHMTRVGLAVVITTTTEITTKKKKQKMVFLRVEDLTGGLEAVVFPSTYDKLKDSIVESEPLLIEGKINVVQTDDGKVSKIIVDTVKPIMTQRRTTNELLEANVSVSKVEKLLALLQQYKGDTYKVRISLTTADGTKFRIPEHKSIGDYKGVFLHKVRTLA